MEKELEQRKPIEITAGLMKNMAIVLMFFNHAAYSILSQAYGITDGFLYDFQWYITRPAFVIFAFQIGEGMVRTHDRKKYLMRLGALALISEIPFNLCFDRTLIATGGTNVFFTLFFGAFGIYMIEKLEGKKSLQWLVALACFTAVILLQTDYDAMGVAIIFAFYFFRENKKKMFITVALLLFFGYIFIYIGSIAMYFTYSNEYGLLFLKAVVSNAFEEFHGVLAFPFIALYKGKKGRMLNKWFYYFFYPAHLLLVYFIVGALM